MNWNCYRYAPESFRASYNGKPLLLTSEEKSVCGNLAVCGKRKEVNDELKRIVRKIRKQRRRVTFGFFQVDSNKFNYTREIGAYDDDLQDKLRAFKLWKRFCESKKCVLSTVEITAGDITPDGKQNNTTTIENKVDLSRPLKIKYKYERSMI